MKYRKLAKRPGFMRKKASSRSRKRRISGSDNSPIDHIMFLQRTIGNQAVMRMLNKGAESKEQSAESREQSALRLAPCAFQAKPSGDQITPQVQMQTRTTEEEEEETLQAKEDSSHSNKDTSKLEARISSLQGSGKPLSKSTRDFFEPRFGQDFSGVNVHTDEKAAESAQSVNARAFTMGRDIVFGKGQYAPEKIEGKRLLGHELTHVVQQDQTSIGAIQRFVPEDAAEEMVGKTFLLNTDLKVSGQTIPKGSSVVITTWENDKTSVTADFKSGGKTTSVTIEKNFLVPADDTKSGLSKYHAGVADIEKKYTALEKKISAQEKVVLDWKAEEKKYTTAKGRAEWQRQMDVKEAELKDLKYKLKGEGYTSATLPERLKKTASGVKVSITPQSTLLNKALIEETMFNSFDASIVKWVAFYNKSIGSKKKWSALDANLVKSMLYQESHMGTLGDFLLLPPYTKGQRMTRFNIGQAIDSSGPQQILMIKEISPAIATKHNLDQVAKDMFDAQARRKELVKKGSSRTPAEQMELDTINARTAGGNRWNDFFTSDPRWIAAIEEFFTETVKARNLDYDYWIRTAVRWLFQKRDGVKDWDAAIKAYNGSGKKAERYKKDVIGRRDTAKAATKEFIPKQHY